MEESPAALQYKVLSLIPQAQQQYITITTYAAQLRQLFCQKYWTHIVYTCFVFMAQQVSISSFS